MSQFVRALFDRLAARFAAVFAKQMAASVQTLHAEQEAECQSRLEDLARRYEADGKPEVAACLRQQARLVVGDDPAALGAALLDRLGDPETPASPPVVPPLPEAPAPAVAPPTKSGRRRLSLPGESQPPAGGEGQP